MNASDFSTRAVRDRIDSVHLVPQLPPQLLERGRGNNYRGRALALCCSIPALPVALFLMALVKLTSRGPALFAQARVGRAGRIFIMYKIRSMVHDAESHTGPTWACPEDPRVTWVGRLLRATHLDELPQLVNVMRGEMAIFGPRPERPEMIPVLAQQIPDYLHRLAVLPGITGLAQINFPPDETVECVRRKLQLDLEYIQTANWRMEVRMFLWTLMRLMMVPAGIATRYTGLHREVAIDPLPTNLSAPAEFQANPTESYALALPTTEAATRSADSPLNNRLDSEAASHEDHHLEPEVAGSLRIQRVRS